MKNLFAIIFLLISSLATGQKPDFKFHGLKIFVDDLDEAVKFYGDFLGFDIRDKNEVLVVTGQSFPISIHQSQEKSKTNYALKTRISLALQVNKLLPEIDVLRANELRVYDSLLARNGVGIAIPFEDYAGNVLSFIEVQIYDPGPINNIRVYNCGVTISDMDKASDFYLDILGFQEWSRNYLPAALPLKHNDGSFAFMIHAEKGLKPNESEYGNSPRKILTLSTLNLAIATEYLANEGVTILDESSNGLLICRDPEGNIIEITEDD